ncbi:MAG: MATE family efflux transporter [Clostridiales bacterium]|nr:MATE family efflux transporter [Clostridiales bacterium]
MANNEQSKALEKNMSEGSVFKNLVLFSAPFLISNIIQSLYNVADMLIVGNFCGPASMSGVNIGGQVTFILTNIVIGLCIGATVLIGQYMGSNEREPLRRVIATIITLLVILSLIITPLMLIFRDPLLTLIKTPPESIAESRSYLTVTVAGIFFIFGYNALSAIMRGMGNSKQPFYFVLVACVINIALDLIFVAVFDMAAFGAALATVISQAVSMFLCVAFLIKNNFLFDFKLSSFKIYKEEFKSILRIGFPTCIQNAITSISFLFITAIINDIGGMFASAAVGAVGKFNSFVFMPTMAISASISTISAQNIGAGKLDRAIQSCKIGTIMSVIISYIFFALVQIFPGEVIRLFGDDPAMIENGISYLRSFSFDFLIIPFIFCINGLFIGGGHTLFSLFNSMLSSILLRVPASYIFGSVMKLGLLGAGMGAPIASVGSLIVIIIFLISGKWKRNIARGGPVVEGL